MNKHLILLTFGISLWSCINPTEPKGVSSELLATINTSGYCRSIDIKDSILVAAADEAGYQSYSFTLNGNTIDHTLLFSSNMVDADTYLRGDKVIISKLRDFFLVMDKNDGIWVRGFAEDDLLSAIEFNGSGNRDYVKSMVLYENDERFVVYTLNKDTDGRHYILARIHYRIEGIDDLWFVDFAETSGIDIYTDEMAISDSLIALANSQLGVRVFEIQADWSLTEMYSFDTQGEVQTVFINGTTVFTGLSDDRGCYIYDPVDNCTENTIAEGYSVKAIDLNEELLVMACGSDGILLYERAGVNCPEELGRIESAYVYDVKIFDNNTIFAATKDGVQIFKIER